MQFPRLLVLLVAASVASVAIAGPIRRSFDNTDDLIEREEDYALERRLNAAQIGHEAKGVMAKQVTKKENKQNRVQPKASKAQRTASYQAKAKTPAQKQTVKAAQTARRTARPPGVKGPAATAKKPKPAPRLSTADKAQVKGALKAAGTAHRATTNMPGRKDTFTKGAVSRTGKDARVAVFNSHLHNAAPVGANNRARPPVAGVPKHFGNHAYKAGHPQAGQHPLPGAPSGSRSNLKEYPVKSGSKVGYTGTGDRGKVRAIVEKTGPNSSKFHGLVTHVSTPGQGKSGDHYKMTHTTPPPKDSYDNFKPGLFKN